MRIQPGTHVPRVVDMRADELDAAEPDLGKSGELAFEIAIFAQRVELD